MRSYIGLVVFLCVQTWAACEGYRAATFANNGITPNAYASVIQEAGKANVDILVLPAPDQSVVEDNYDEIIKSVSKATKQAGLYVVAHLFEKTRCQNKIASVRSNLVFDRTGSIISVYRKPVNNVANCTTTDSELVMFETDFGVNFGLLMEEDLVLYSTEHLKGLKNFVITGTVLAEIPFLAAAQFLPSWSYINKANLVSSAGIYGYTKSNTTTDKLIIADLNTDLSVRFAPVVKPIAMDSFPGEDLSQYIIRPLDVEASLGGHKETVCHRDFCCEFQVKASFIGHKATDVNYGLAAFDGVRHYSGNHNIGTQNCALFACAGLYKRSCSVGSVNNSTNVVFQEITVTANFTKRNSAQYPMVQSTDLSSDRLKFDTRINTRSKVVTAQIHDIQNLLTFGIFGRDYSKDYDSEFVSVKRNDTEGLTNDIYDYIYSEDVQEFFDYVWIRLRVLIFVVSIYILEML